MTYEERQYNALLEVVEEAVTDEEFAEIMEGISDSAPLRERFNLLADIAKRVIPEAPFRVTGQLRNDLLNTAREAAKTGDVATLRKVFEKIDAEQPRLQRLRKRRSVVSESPTAKETSQEKLDGLMDQAISTGDPSLSTQEVAHSIVRAMDTHFQQRLHRPASSKELLVSIKDQEQMIVCLREIANQRARTERNDLQ